MKIKSIFILMNLFLFINCFSQTSKNLDFEQVDKLFDYLPTEWVLINNGFEIKADTLESYNGKRCVKISNLGSGTTGIIQQSFEPGYKSEKLVRLKGFIKSENITDGYAGLILRLETEDKIIYMNFMESKGVKGDTEWKEYELVTKADSRVKRITYGCYSKGKGVAWFDNLTLEITSTPSASKN